MGPRLTWPEHRLAAREGEEVVGWAALTPVSRRAVYAGVADLSVYVAGSGPRARRRRARCLPRSPTAHVPAGSGRSRRASSRRTSASLALHRSARLPRGRRPRADRPARRASGATSSCSSCGCERGCPGGPLRVSTPSGPLDGGFCSVLAWLDAEAGQWEAADLQWWWRTPRRSDTIDDLFWLDDDVPVAGVVLTDWGEAWGCDPSVVCGCLDGSAFGRCWGREPSKPSTPLGSKRSMSSPVTTTSSCLVCWTDAGFVADDDELSGTTWMDCRDRRCGPTAGRFRARGPRDKDLDEAAPHAATKRRRGRGAPPAVLALRRGARSRRPRLLSGLHRRLRALLVRPRDQGRAGGADESRGLVPAARDRSRPCSPRGSIGSSGRGARRLKVSYATDVARALYVGACFRVTATEHDLRAGRRRAK